MKRILCFGDSNTYGYDPRSFFGDRYGAQNRWTDLLAASTGWAVCNAGQNGRSIPPAAMASRLLAPYGEMDALVVMLGSNDLLQGCSAAETTARMEAFLQPLLSCYPHILLIAPPPMQRGEWVPTDALVSESVLLADCYRQLSQRLGVDYADGGSWNVELTFDGVHFTERGHHAFAAGVREVLACSLA